MSKNKMFLPKLKQSRQSGGKVAIIVPLVVAVLVTAAFAVIAALAPPREQTAYEKLRAQIVLRRALQAALDERGIPYMREQSLERLSEKLERALEAEAATAKRGSVGVDVSFQDSESETISAPTSSVPGSGDL